MVSSTGLSFFFIKKKKDGLSLWLFAWPAAYNWLFFNPASDFFSSSFLFSLFYFHLQRSDESRAFWTMIGNRGRARFVVDHTGPVDGPRGFKSGSSFPSLLIADTFLGFISVVHLCGGWCFSRCSAADFAPRQNKALVRSLWMSCVGRVCLLVLSVYVLGCVCN